MSCMKCGRKTEAEQIFCPDCLKEMERYPVKPDIAVLLPTHQEKMPKKAAKRARLSPEEQIGRLKRRNKHLARWLAGFVVLSALLGVTAGYLAGKVEVQKVIGQNYSIIDTTGNTGGN